MGAQAISVQQLLAGSRGRLGLTQVLHTRGLANRLRSVQLQRNTAFANIGPLRPNVILVVQPVPGAGLITGDLEARRSFREAVRTARIPCIFISASEHVPAALRDVAQQTGVPLVSSALDALLLESRLTGLLRQKIHHHVRMHGVLLKMFGAGVLIRGDSGAGKTRLGMMLAQRGHAWISDDIVEIREKSSRRISARGVPAVRDLVDFKESGVRKIRDVLAGRRLAGGADLRMILEIQPDDDRNRRCSENNRVFRKVLGVRIPCMPIPSPWGRNFDLLEIEKRIRKLAQE
jgi:HPr kinase/phosphorylase